MSTDYNARYMPKNHFLDAELIVTPTPPAMFPKEYLQSYAHSEVVQGGTDPSYPTPPYTAVPNLVVDGNFTGGFRRFSGINTQWSNLTADATVRYQIYDGQNQTGSIIYDSGAVGALQYKTFEELDWLIDGIIAIKDYGTSIGRNSFWYHDVTIGQSFKITYSNPTNENGYIEINNIYLGEWITTDINIQYGSQWGIVDTTTQSLRNDGTTSALKGTESDYISLEYAQMDRDDRTILNDKIVRSNGKHTAFWADVYPEEVGTALNQHHAGVFLLTNDPSLGYEQGNLSSVSFELRRV